MSVVRHELVNPVYHDDQSSSSSQSHSELDAFTACNDVTSEPRSRSQASDTEENTTYASMTRQLSNNDTQRSPRGHVDYDVLTSNRAVSVSTSSDTSVSHEAERVMMCRSIVHEASESDDDDDDDGDLSKSDYVQFNPSSPSSPASLVTSPPPVPSPSPVASVFNADCSTTDRSASTQRGFRDRIQSASVLQSSHSCDEDTHVSYIITSSPLPTVLKVNLSNGLELWWAKNGPGLLIDGHGLDYWIWVFGR